ncbi:DUF11 domain-containing protein, partial [Patescibacteria group bacterium]|nr:DUF11 domain-containing protein [Patescibacteria group bacterium]
MKANSYNHNPKRGKVYRVINIFITMAFLFNMSAVQGLMLATPAQAIPGVPDKYTLCHATGSASNPWVRINVAEPALSAHLESLQGNPLIGHENDVLLGLDNDNVLECPAPEYPICGDQIVNGDEQCDGDAPLDCTTDAGYAGIQECNMPVRAFSTNDKTTLPDWCTWNECLTQESCGDGTVNGPEECDDGNDANGDGCSATCKVETYDIYGIKWNDLNGNGERDCDPVKNAEATTVATPPVECEPIIPGWGITLDGGGPVYTNGDGEFWFLNLLAGTYQLCEVQQDGWMQTYPEADGCHEVTFPLNADGLKKPNYDFGNQELEPATIYASKVICDSEEDLPNWGGGSGPDITFASVNNWVDQHSDHCQLVQDWQFQWGYDEDVSNLNPGDNTGEEIASGKWNTFSVADPIVLNDLGQNNKIWLREVWDSNYIPFSSDITLPFDTVSAEFYCNDDHLFYDNFEWISNLELGHEYRCVAFNVQNPQYGTISGTKTDTDINYLNDWEICLTPELNKDATALTVPQEVCVNTGSGEWADGYYEFTNVMPGAYKIQETMQNGWVATQPVEEFYSLTVEAGAEYDLDFINEYAGYCGDRIVQENEECDGNDEGSDIPDNYYCTEICTLQENEHATVSGYKYEDLNGNGEWDPGEMPLNDWEICRTYESGQTQVDPPGAGTNALQEAVLVPAIEGPGDDVPLEPISDCVLTGSGEWEAGYYEFKYYMGGHTSLAETMQDGYTKTQPVEETYEIEIVEPTVYGSYYFGNQPDFGVSIEKTADVDQVLPNQEFNYSIAWEVLGLVTADEVVITDTLPADVSFVSATDGGVYDVSTHTVTWTLTDVAPGTSGVYGITVQTVSGVTDGEELINNVEILATKYLNQTAGTNVSSSSVAPIPVVSQIARSDTANAVVTVSIPKLLPTLSLDKKVSSGAAESNEQLTYTIDWSVAGNADAHQVIITDPIPTDTGIVSVYSGGVYDGALNTATWDLGTKSPGDSGSVTMVVNTNLALTAGTVVKNTAN